MSKSVCVKEAQYISEQKYLKRWCVDARNSRIWWKRQASSARRRRLKRELRREVLQ